MNNSNSEVKFALGFIFGMVAGLSIGFIFAPKSGEDTRELLKNKVNGTGDKVLELATDVGGTIREAIGDREKIYKETWSKPKRKPYTEKL
jgi:gas vesicle protein